MHKVDAREVTQDLLRISGADPKKCMKCGRCSASCPAFDEMDILPHQFVAMVARGDVEGLLKCKSIWNCLSCFACIQRCPRGVEPAKLIEAVRIEILRPQGANRLTANDIPALLDDKLPQQALVSAFRKYSK